MPHSNTVELIQITNILESACVAAWASTALEMGVLASKHSTLTNLFEALVQTKTKTPKDLLSFLLDHGHESPFEHNIITFAVTCDIASHIHLLKHRIGVSINSESARYKELQDKSFIPTDWPIAIQRKLENHTRANNKLYHECIADLEPVLGRKRAKESARYFLGYNKQITSIVSMNYRSFMHFYMLRSSPSAQVEIREIATMMKNLIKPHSPFLVELLEQTYS